MPAWGIDSLRIKQMVERMHSQEQVHQQPSRPVTEAQDLPFMGEAPINELRNGNAQAMITFFELFHPSLCYFADRLIKDKPAAEDIVEDSFLKLWKKHSEFESTQHIKAFLYLTTKNACLNFLKQVERDAISKREMAYLIEEKEDYVLNEMVRTEVVQEVYSAIEKLPAQSRKVLKMSVFENMKNREIAIALAVSIHTVKNQKVRAMQLLRLQLHAMK